MENLGLIFNSCTKAPKALPISNGGIMIKILIVDDEPLACEELNRLVLADKDCQIAGIAANGEEALRLIESREVDAVFLDIDMPGMNGLEVASWLAQWEHPPRVIFATAHNEYAMKAFDLSAIDYVLKPYQPERIQKALIRLKEVLKVRGGEFRDRLIALEDNLIRKGMLRKLAGHRRNSKERIVLDPMEVLYFQVRLSEVFAYQESGELIVRSTLKELLETLDPAQFAQTHKAYLVNVGKVEKVAPLFSGNFEITLKNSKRTKIPLSRRYSGGLKALLGGW